MRLILTVCFCVYPVAYRLWLRVDFFLDLITHCSCLPLPALKAVSVTKSICTWVQGSWVLLCQFLDFAQNHVFMRFGCYAPLHVVIINSLARTSMYWNCQACRDRQWISFILAWNHRRAMRFKLCIHRKAPRVSTICLVEISTCTVHHQGGLEKYDTIHSSYCSYV